MALREGEMERAQIPVPHLLFSRPKLRAEETPRVVLASGCPVTAITGLQKTLTKDQELHKIPTDSGPTKWIPTSRKITWYFNIKCHSHILRQRWSLKGFLASPHYENAYIPKVDKAMLENGISDTLSRGWPSQAIFFSHFLGWRSMWLRGNAVRHSISMLL